MTNVDLVPLLIFILFFIISLANAARRLMRFRGRMRQEKQREKDTPGPDDEPFWEDIAEGFEQWEEEPEPEPLDRGGRRLTARDIVREKRARERAEFEVSVRGRPGKGSVLAVSVPVVAPGRFELKRRTFTDTLLEDLGVISRNRSGDRRFDKEFVMLVEGRYPLKVVFSSFGAKESVRDIFALGFDSVELREGKLTAERWNWKESEGGEEEARMAAGELDRFARQIPDYPPGAYHARKEKGFHRVLAFVLPLALGAEGVAALVFGIRLYTPWDFTRPLAVSALAGLAAWIIFLPYAAHLLRGRVNSYREWLAAAFVGFAGFAVAGAGNGLYLNGYLDRSQPITEHAVVIKKDAVAEEMGIYQLRLEFRGGHRLWVPVKGDAYRNAVPGKSRVMVISGSGRFGWKWFREIRMQGATAFG